MALGWEAAGTGGQRQQRPEAARGTQSLRRSPPSRAGGWVASACAAASTLAVPCTRGWRTMARRHWCNARRQLAVAMDMTDGCVTGLASWGRRQKAEEASKLAFQAAANTKTTRPIRPSAALGRLQRRLTPQHLSTHTPAPSRRQPQPGTTRSTPRPRHGQPYLRLARVVTRHSTSVAAHTCAWAAAMTSPQRPPPRAAWRAPQPDASAHDCTASLPLTIATHDTQSNRSQTSGIRFGIPRASILLAALVP
jgi:hypothetical protein